MKPLSDDQLSEVLHRWETPTPPPGLAAGVWARVDAPRLPTFGWLNGAWAFRTALALTVLLWVAAALTPPRASPDRATNSLTAALAQAGAVQ